MLATSKATPTRVMLVICYMNALKNHDYSFFTLYGPCLHTIGEQRHEARNGMPSLIPLYYDMATKKTLLPPFLNLLVRLNIVPRSLTNL